MAVKLLRCKNVWLTFGGHPCWRVQKALDEPGVDYEAVHLPTSRGKRDQIESLTGQKKYPAIQFEDGSIYREESKDMAARIRSGRLSEAQGDQGSPAVSQPTST